MEELGADPYAADDVMAALLQAEAMLKSNNARVTVDWKGVRGPVFLFLPLLLLLLRGPPLSACAPLAFTC